ncbi:hypothetical protein [Micromonospora chersina]|uniref:hypothetical protein n=1 Tax=Micromonospora chersina TaxID=47854 RepID=UPI003720401A
MTSYNLCSYGQRMADHRPTPADPTPHLAAAKRNGARQRDLPPELDPGSIAVLSGATFMYSTPSVTSRWARSVGSFISTPGC